MVRMREHAKLFVCNDWCTAVEIRSSIRLCEAMIAFAGLVHSKGVGCLFHARR